MKTERIEFGTKERLERTRRWMERKLGLEQDLLNDGETIASNLVLDGIAAAQTMEKMFASAERKGKQKSLVRAEASRENGRKGGRPKKQRLDVRG